jgi:hypothetical protein
LFFEVLIEVFAMQKQKRSVLFYWRWIDAVQMRLSTHTRLTQGACVLYVGNYIHTYTYVCIHRLTCIHTYIDAYTNTRPYIHTYTYTHTYKSTSASAGKCVGGDRKGENVKDGERVGARACTCRSRTGTIEAASLWHEAGENRHHQQNACPAPGAHLACHGGRRGKETE